MAWWDGGDLRVGVVGGEEKRKIRLVLEGGHEIRVPPARLAFRIEGGGTTPGKTVEQLRSAGERAAAAAERIRQQAASCDVRVLWEIAGESPRPYTVEALAGLAFESDSGSDRAALVRALLDDGIHFVRKGDGWEPRPSESVEQLLLQRRRTSERAQAKLVVFDALKSAARGRGFEPSGDRIERRYLDALHELALRDLDASESAQELGSEALAASGLAFDRLHEGAFRLLRILGRFDSDDENTQLIRYGLEQVFPEEVLNHASRAASSGFSRAGRSDLTGLDVLTIDSPHTREIDDGLSLETLADGRFRLGIHIADPAAVVHPDDPVDREALARAVTHYLPDRKLLMIPEPISENAASLLPDDERPVLSFVVDLNGGGDVSRYEVVRAVIRSRACLSYDEADRSIRESSGAFAEVLAKLAELSKLREERRIEDGAIVILAPEVDLHVDAEGRMRLERHPADSPSRGLVNEMMVLAGAIAARFCTERGIPVIYRRQPAPERPVELPPEGLPELVRARAARRSLRKGEVGLQPGPHFALGLPAYVQVTSPLRRFQDLATHRQIVSALEEGSPFYDVETLQRIAATTEQAELNARKVERWADRYWLLRYLEQQLGQTVFGVVVATEPRPIVQLEETLIEQPVRALQGVELGQRVELRVEHVNPRAELLVLRSV